MTTTTSTTSTASTATAASASSTKTTSSTKNYGQSILTSLSAGSGVDVKTLAQNLVDAEKAPQADAINSKIQKCEARISGYGALSYILGNLRTKCSALDDLSDFNNLTTSISQTSAFNAETSDTASVGNHTISVSQLAQGQRSISSAGFASATATLPNALSLDMTLGGTALSSISIAAGSTVNQMVASINSAWGSKGITAQLVNKGDAASDPSAPYYLVISGPSGASNSFSLSGLDMAATAIQDAQNAKLTVDGVAVQSASNTVSEAIPGVKLNLTATTTGTASLNMTRDISSVQTKIEDLVTAYNDVMSVLSATSSPDSTLDTYGASLVGDSTVSLIRSQVRSMFFGASSSPGTSIKAMRDLGISVDSTGTMTLDQAKMTSALQNNFDDAVKMLSASRATPTTIHTFHSGITGDAVKTLTDMLGPSGTLATQSANAKTLETRYKDNLTRLDDRMSKLLDRYNQQFTAMESLVSQINSQKSSLKSTFDAMTKSSN
jgi:flagellar hook-associated protein 2